MAEVGRTHRGRPLHKEEEALVFVFLFWLIFVSYIGNTESNSLGNRKEGNRKQSRKQKPRREDRANVCVQKLFEDTTYPR